MKEDVKLLRFNKVIQLVPAFHYGDAIGESIRNLAKWLNARQIKNEIYALEIDAEIRNEAYIYYNELLNTDDKTLIILHYALPSILDEAYKSLRGRKMIMYHNITPPEYFLNWNKELVYLTYAGREQLKSLVDYTDLAVADSEYNKSELDEMGYKNTMVCPIWVPFNQFQGSVNEILLEAIKKKTIFLFVGRVVPNKKIEDTIKIIYWYRENVDANAILVIVGKYNNAPKYYYWLREYGKALHFSEEELIFTGHVPYVDLAAYYKGASVFISMSEHEGFCVPLVESMYFELPIVAYASAAVPEILGDAGILVYTKKFEYIAELLAELIKDNELKKMVIEKQRRRLSYFSDDNIIKIWHNIFSFF